MTCIKCGSNSIEVRQEGPSIWDHCMMCGRDFNFRDDPIALEYREMMRAVQKKQVDPLAEKIRAKKSTEKPEDGCTFYSASFTSTGKKTKYYCGDPRFPGSKFCQPHRDKMKQQNLRNKEEHLKSNQPSKNGSPVAVAPEPAPDTQKARVLEVLGVQEPKKSEKSEKSEIQIPSAAAIPELIAQAYPIINPPPHITQTISDLDRDIAELEQEAAVIAQNITVLKETKLVLTDWYASRKA